MFERATGAAAAAREEPFAASTLGLGSVVELRPSHPAELLAPLSGAFDLAESQAPGHAARVAHLAMSIAGELGVDTATRRSVLYAALLHDAGIAVRELPEGEDGSGGHTAAGAWVASRMGLDKRVAKAIRCSHERWDGAGRPRSLAMKQVPAESLIVSAAHWACDIVQDLESPLRARAMVQRASPRDIEPMVGPRIAAALGTVLHDDAMWTAFWDDRLPALVAAAAGGEGRASVKQVERVAAAMGEVVDAAMREPGRSRRVAQLAMELARQLGAADGERRAIGVAAMLLDIGQLGVPRHITEKPSILSVSEMEQVHRHPGWGSRIVEMTPGMEEIGRWVEAHHERPDGRGYPELLAGDEIPVASRILSVADSYWALRAERAYRDAFSEAEALALIQASAGQQYDAELVVLLPVAIVVCEGVAGGA